MTISTAAQVRTAWASVFNVAAVKAITERSYNYNLIELVDQAIATGTFDSRMMYKQQVNFFQYTVIKNQILSNANDTNYEFIVNLSYVREVDTTGDNYHAAQDCMETIHTAIDSALGATWSDTVSGYIYESTAPQIQLIKLSDKDVWLTTYQFIGLS